MSMNEKDETCSNLIPHRCLLEARKLFIHQYMGRRVRYAPRRFGVVYDITHDLKLLIRREEVKKYDGEKAVLILEYPYEVETSLAPGVGVDEGKFGE